MPVVKGVFFFLSRSLTRGTCTVVVDVDGVIFHSPIIELARVIPPSCSRPLLCLAMKVYQNRSVRRVIRRLLRLNRRIIVHAVLYARHGCAIVYCTGRTATAIPELVSELIRLGAPLHGVVSRAYEPVDNPTLKLYAVLILKHLGLRVVEVYDDSCKVCKQMTTLSPCICGKKLLSILRET